MIADALKGSFRGFSYASIGFSIHSFFSKFLQTAVYIYKVIRFSICIRFKPRYIIHRMYIFIFIYFWGAQNFGKQLYIYILKQPSNITTITLLKHTSDSQKTPSKLDTETTLRHFVTQNTGTLQNSVNMSGP